MLVSVLPVPFADAARQRQYDAVLTALHMDTDAPATVLLGNLGAFTTIEADMLFVRPDALALVVLTPRAGQLTIPTLTYGTWLLSGQPLPGREGADNPFAQYQQQLPAVLAWLDEQLVRPVGGLLPCVGMALFEAPLTFGAGVEAQLHRHAAAHDFQLVGDAAQVPTRLQQQTDGKANILAEFELLDWAYSLLGEPTTAGGQGVEPNLGAILEQKLRQLWRWLGAEDIPADPPYGGPPPDQHLRDQQEQARLQQLRQELQAELHQQRQEAATREAARNQELALLRQQLAQAGPSATERQAEQHAKETLEESLRTARAELAARNQELDTKIQHLGQLINQLQAAPAATTPSATRVSSGQKRAATAPTWSFRRLRQVERWGVVLVAWVGVGVGTWGLVRWVQHTASHPTTTITRSSSPRNRSEADNSDDQEPTADSLARMQAEAVDTAANSSAQPEPTSSEAATSSEPIAPPVELHVDSSAAVVKPTPLIHGADSAATSPSPAP
ncbi:MAG: hypothetical protein ACRYFZ_19130 [Janthinobacterium lividum]